MKNRERTWWIGESLMDVLSSITRLLVLQLLTSGITKEQLRALGDADVNRIANELQRTAKGKRGKR